MTGHMQDMGNAFCYSSIIPGYTGDMLIKPKINVTIRLRTV